jgi:hypothetical protein
MANSDSKKERDPHQDEAWTRFERAVDVVAKSPPQHRTKKTKSLEAKTAKKKPTDSR